MHAHKKCSGNQTINKPKKSYGGIYELIFNIIKLLRNYKKQPNEDSRYATINKDLTSVTMEN